MNETLIITLFQNISKIEYGAQQKISLISGASPIVSVWCKSTRVCMCVCVCVCVCETQRERERIVASN